MTYDRYAVIETAAKATLKATLATALIFGLTGLAQAQQPQAPRPRAAPPTTTAQAAPAADPAAGAAPAGWIARCASGGRAAPMECAIEQSAVLTKTGQLVVLVNIRIPPDSHTPVMLAQLPLGLNLPVGAALQIDNNKAIDLPIQTCENRGCFANMPLAPEMLATMRTGKQLKLSFQTLSKETITIPMQLTDFAAAYDKIR